MALTGWLVNPHRRKAKKHTAKRSVIKHKAHKIRRIIKKAIKKIKRRKTTMSKSRKHLLTTFGVPRNLMISRASQLTSRSRGRRLNPFKLPNMGNIKETAVDVASALIGFTGVKLIPKYIVPAQYLEGYMGYAVQVGTGVALYMITAKVLKKPRIAKMILLGSLLAVANDIMQKVLPISDMGYWTPDVPSYSGRAQDSFAGVGDGQKRYK